MCRLASQLDSSDRVQPPLVYLSRCVPYLYF